MLFKSIDFNNYFPWSKLDIVGVKFSTRRQNATPKADVFPIAMGLLGAKNLG